MEDGGSILILMGEGGEGKFETNINFLLEEYGIMVNAGIHDIEYSHTKMINNIESSYWSRLDH